ncbi:MAG TPA: monovalent cation/H(+) antiporter subunit G [Chloroflexota bacterium]|nr:monovalent cation/H(+) antiporter subunit G [Chloroflexota bacterium]HUM70601.1 monovalent cation/H(+) antiporter subunit G [Chloroflexota bacterium]
MDTITQSVAFIAVLVGTFFSVVGVVGYIRLPDVYTRLHATGKVGLFGVVLLLVAAVMWTPLGWGKALLLMVLLMVSGPVAAHAIASAAYRLGVPMKDAVRNDLQEGAGDHHDPD